MLIIIEPARDTPQNIKKIYIKLHLSPLRKKLKHICIHKNIFEIYKNTNFLFSNLKRKAIFSFKY